MMKGGSAKRKGGSARGALSLFEAGDGPAAWKMLLSLRGRVRDPENIDEARRVAAATMRAARASLEEIVLRLKESGYQFARPGTVLVAPPPDATAKLDELEALVGPLPLSLRAAFEHVGVVNLAGDHPSWPRSANVHLRSVRDESEVWFTDPFALTSIDAVLDQVIEGGVRGSIGFAGDPYTKAGYSGDIYRVRVPCRPADGKIEGHPRGHTFVEHLRAALQNGGFAGFATMPDAPRELIDVIVRGLPPI